MQHKFLLRTLGHNQLPQETNVSINNSIYEIRWHGRGGQGVVTAAKIVAYAAFLDGYRGVTSAPFFGAERRGIPVSALTRISFEPVLIVSQIESPDTVVILDQTLLKYNEVLSGLREKGWVIVNSIRHPAELNLPSSYNVAAVDATGICKELGLVVSGVPVVNTAIVGALAHATRIVSLQSLEKAVREKFANDTSQLNVSALIKTYQSTVIFTKC